MVWLTQHNCGYPTKDYLLFFTSSIVIANDKKFTQMKLSFQSYHDIPHLPQFPDSSFQTRALLSATNMTPNLAKSRTNKYNLHSHTHTACKKVRATNLHVIIYTFLAGRCNLIHGVSLLGFSQACRLAINLKKQK